MNWRPLLILFCIASLAAAATPATGPTTGPTTAPVEPKPLSANVTRGLRWLAAQQQADGGWNQGEASKDLGREGEQIDKSNVADTCMAALAFVRAGNTPASKGDYSNNVAKAVAFVCDKVEKSSQDGLEVTDVKGTRVQTKLGPQVDTFAAALFLAEARNTMPDDAGKQRVAAALDKIMAKLSKNQKDNGAWVDAHDGWASALCQSMGHKAVNVAFDNGAVVEDKVLASAQTAANDAPDFNLAKAGSERTAGLGGAPPASSSVFSSGAAGVELYARSSKLSSLQASDVSNAKRSEQLAQQRGVATTRLSELKQKAEQADKAGKPQEAQQATEQMKTYAADLQVIDGSLKDIKDNRENLERERAGVVERLGDKDFIAGFGSNGGEEFLSYMNIGETLVLKGGADWEKWDKSMTENLNRVQSEDGSWSGQHCITGRTFCTSSALMVLMSDRAGAGDSSRARPVAHELKPEGQGKGE